MIQRGLPNVVCETGCWIGDQEFPREEVLGLTLVSMLSWLHDTESSRLEEPAVTPLSLINEAETGGEGIGGRTMSSKRQWYHDCSSEKKNPSATQVQSRGRSVFKRSFMKLSTSRVSRNWSTSRISAAFLVESLGTTRHPSNLIDRYAAFVEDGVVPQ